MGVDILSFRHPDICPPIMTFQDPDGPISRTTKHEFCSA